AVVEIKGVQQLDQLVKVIEHEMQRQHGLIQIAQKLKERKVDFSKVGDRIEDVTDILVKAQSKIVKKILDGGGIFRALRAPGFAGMIGFEPYPDIRIGKELGKLVRFYDLDGVFHSDELPNYGITEQEVAAVKSKLQAGGSDAFVIVGGPKDKVGFASDAIIRRLQAAVNGVPAETRAATPDGKTVFLRPRPGAARMYPETDIPTIPVTDSALRTLADKVPRSWDEVLKSLMKRYSLNEKLAKEIFDSDYLNVFEEMAGKTKVPPTFIASKLTEDLTSLQRQGLDASVLTDGIIKDIFARLDAGAIAKESVNIIFEKLMKNEARTVDEAIKGAGVSSISDEELGMGLDRIINDNVAVVKEKGMGALSTLMGRAMAEFRGKADGAKINAMLKDKLEKQVK
ncbi:MAG: Glu-tRNA(Gln) amidotransferase subunit GatE, partial [Nitrososphaera sp.]